MGWGMGAVQGLIGGERGGGQCQSNTEVGVGWVNKGIWW